jgi:hypothetical protein
MTWFTEAQALKEQGKTHREIAETLGKNINTVHSRFSRLKRKEAAGETVATVKVEEKPTTTDEQIQATLLKALKKPKAISDLLVKVTEDVNERRLLKNMEVLKDAGYIIDNLGGRYVLRTITNMEHNIVEKNWLGDKVIRFGIASDAHMNSKYQQLTHLNHFYDICEAEGITTVYNPGDLAEGEYISRRGHAYEIFNHSADDQVQYIIDNYPKRDGITTEFITGNHDHTFLKNAGYDIGKRIDMERDDMKYLGMNNASIMLTPNCRMDLSHPLDGSSYALSYSLQKSIEAMPVDDLPQIYIVGHHHKAIYLNTRGIHALEAGTFQAQSSWMKGKRLAAHVGGWIITVHVNDLGQVTRFIPEWVAFNKMVKDDF